MTAAAKKGRSAGAFPYYFISLCALYLIPVATAYLWETNLPPLKKDVRFIINLLFLNLAAAYYFYLKNFRENEKIGKKGWGLLLLLGAVLCVTPPIFSGDVNEYLLRGRILAVHHANPYYHVPREFPQDMLYPYTSWWDAPHTYGPIFVYIQTLPVLIFPDSIVGMVASLKLIFFGFLIGTCAYFGKVLKLLPVQNKGWLFAAFALNPLFIVSTLLDGHNDIVMVFFTVAAVYHLLRGQHTRCFLFWTLSFLVKYTVVLLLPFLIILSVRSEHRKDPSKTWAFILKQLILNTLLIVAVFAPFWRGVETFGVLLKVSQWFYSNTVPYMTHQALNFVGLHVAQLPVKYAFLAAFLCLYAYWIRRTVLLKEGEWVTVFRVFSAAYLAFFCSITSPVMSNYFMWVLPWLLLSGLPLPNFFVTLVSFTALFFYFKRPNYLMALAVMIYGAALFMQGLKARRGSALDGGDQDDGARVR